LKGFVNNFYNKYIQISDGGALLEIMADLTPKIP
jgi:hypothetical protein